MAAAETSTGRIETIIDLENPNFSFKPISKRGNSKDEAISVENYIQIRSSFGGFIDLDDEDEIMEIKPFRSINPKKERKPMIGVSVIEIGESSSSHETASGSGSGSGLKKKKNDFVCEICVETRMMSEAFQVKGCRHSFCSECMVRYVASKIQENVTSIGCPEMNCQGVLEPEFCQSILPPEVFDRWGKALCEALILGVQKFYCPFKDCSALLLDEGVGGILQAECPHCRRLFCAQCKVPWHAGIICADFQKLNVDERGREDIMLMEAAKKNKWQRCPKCKFYVERSSGCLFIKCRCGHAFCYNCGAPLKDHYCTVCKR
ncbi:hypothetical protein MKW98_024518 [Papaver atlanticum]|uniref:RBR-type E3 ubiquitin transferase n=1 Tax=Papaver atlanticum TaxID=357466 RepID=A0AAD4RVF0_9MAGN|nr:hypothetical protein MKW98_024518 [Papaver atlanticum]